MVNRVRLVSPCLLLVAAALCGCHNAPPAVPVQATTIPLPPSAQEPTPPPPATPTPAPIKDAVTSLISQSASSPFPKGTQLLGVKLENGVATLDFSKEFNGLANSGDSTEAQAQKSLRATLAKFPEVQKMRVTVAGKSFDSQNTDWDTPFSVRDNAKSAGGEGQGGGQ